MCMVPMCSGPPSGLLSLQHWNCGSLSTATLIFVVACPPKNHIISLTIIDQSYNILVVRVTVDYRNVQTIHLKSNSIKYEYLLYQYRILKKHLGDGNNQHHVVKNERSRRNK